MPQRLKNFFLLAGSALFYYFGDPEFLYVLPASIAVNYLFGLLLSKKKQKWVLWSGILLNLTALCFYKAFEQKIPLGMSFFTFQAIAYLVDVFRGECAPQKNLGRFALLLGSFIKLGSGPIVSNKDMVAELEGRKTDGEEIRAGMQDFILGLSAKILLADRLEILWHEIQSAGYVSITWRYAWLGAIAFSLKLYFDFYGYSLMAVGLGRMMGFHLPANFEIPYLARGVRDFYRKWHITLGMWFRNYVYIPLGGNRKGEGRTVLHLAIVWILTGFWHGMSPNYLLWGLFLLYCILLERLADKISIFKNAKIFPRLYLWFVIPISWMMFAITDVSQLQIYLGRMFGIGDVIGGNVMDWSMALQRHGGILFVSAVMAGGFMEKTFCKRKPTLLGNILLAALFWICAWKIMRQGSNPFMYVNF